MTKAALTIALLAVLLVAWIWHRDQLAAKREGRLVNEWELVVESPRHKVFVEGFKSPEDCHYFFDKHFDEKTDKHRCVPVLRRK